eukprot:7085992-Ditylum_brightwellii.AAC.1
MKDNIPKNLKISPASCIPHESQAFRVILNLSFNTRTKETTLPSVDDTTWKLYKPESMHQLGSTLKQLVAAMADAPDTPFAFIKLDIKDRIWRLVVNPDSAWNFCYILAQQ